MSETKKTSKENFCFYDELMNISMSTSSIRIIFSLTRINDGLIQKYIVGSPKAVSDLEKAVSGMVVSGGKIYAEIFEGY